MKSPIKAHIISRYCLTLKLEFWIGKYSLTFSIQANRELTKVYENTRAKMRQLKSKVMKTKYIGNKVGLKKKEITHNLSGKSTRSLDLAKHIHKKGGWTVIRLPEWAANTDVHNEIKTFCRNIARPRCFWLYGFGQNYMGYGEPRDYPFVAFRYLDHGLQFINWWEKSQNDCYNLYKTGYKEGSREAFEKKVLKLYGQIICIEKNEDFWLYHFAKDLCAQKKIEHLIQNNTIYFAHKKDLMLIKLQHQKNKR